MKAILAVVAVLLAVTHVGDTHNVTITESTYNVREGSCINVIVRTIGAHDFNFTVFLIIADGECLSVMDTVTVHSMLLSCCVPCCSNESTVLANVVSQLHNHSQF